MTMKRDWTPVDGLLHWASVKPDAVYLTQPHDGGEITEYTWSEVEQQARLMAGYLEDLDLESGSSVSYISRNCAHSIITDLAIWMAGFVSVPLYPSLNAKTIAYILEHSEAQLLFVGPLDDWTGMRPGIPDSLPTILFPGASDQLPTDDSRTWEQAIANATPIDEPVPRQQEELARLIYTSGSTGVPKGVMIAFRSMEASGRLVMPLMKQVEEEERLISYLPLAHVFEAAVVETSSLYHGIHVFFSEGLHTFPADLRRARPTFFHSVPRLWVKFQQAVLSQIPQEKLAELLSNEETASATRKQVLTQLGLQDTKVALTGSAPLAPQVQHWYRDLGLELLEGYAMSEDYCLSHLSLPGRSRVGYVGHAVTEVQRRIADNGEVQLKSPGEMLGYFKAPDKTAEAFTDDGWFCTGDLGETDEDGRLRITGRLKEIFKTSKGKYVAPVPIESHLGHPQIEVVCVSGANQPQPYVLMMASAASADALASEAGREALAADLTAILDKVNPTLDPHENVAFAVVTQDAWTIENGMLTPTMKIKRDVIEAKYAERVDEWYAAGQKVVWA